MSKQYEISEKDVDVMLRHLELTDPKNATRERDVVFRALANFSIVSSDIRCSPRSSRAIVFAGTPDFSPRPACVSSASLRSCRSLLPISLDLLSVIICRVV
jgi:hypothetical protein